MTRVYHRSFFKDEVVLFDCSSSLHLLFDVLQKLKVGERVVHSVLDQPFREEMAILSILPVINYNIEQAWKQAGASAGRML